MKIPSLFYILFSLPYFSPNGFARHLLGLRDLFWACETSFGLARPLLALRGLRDLFWPCETSFGLARPLLGLRNLFWACETSFGLARPFLGL